MTFDRAPHERLPLKIKSHDLADPSYSWLTSYLSDYFQIFRTHENLSQSQPIMSGVIQGGVIDPLLFLFYVNDTSLLIRQGTPSLFADDNKPVYSFQMSSWSRTMASIVEDLTSLDQCYGHGEMKVSATKSVAFAYKKLGLRWSALLTV